MGTFKDSLHEMVKVHNGFINLSDPIINQNSNKDKMYGIAIDENDNLSEYYMYALRIVTDKNDNEYLECFLVPKTNTHIVVFTEEDMLSDENADYWYSLDGLDDRLYVWETLVGLMGYIEDFD